MPLPLYFNLFLNRGVLLAGARFQFRLTLNARLFTIYRHVLIKKLNAYFVKPFCTLRPFGLAQRQKKANPLSWIIDVRTE